MIILPEGFAKELLRNKQYILSCIFALLLNCEFV